MSEQLYTSNRKEQVATATQVCCHTDLSNGEHTVPTRNHFVPLVVQQVHVTIGFVPADELGDIGCQRRILREADTVTWKQINSKQ